MKKKHAGPFFLLHQKKERAKTKKRIGEDEAAAHLSFHGFALQLHFVLQLEFILQFELVL